MKFQDGEKQSKLWNDMKKIIKYKNIIFQQSHAQKNIKRIIYQINGQLPVMYKVTSLRIGLYNENNIYF